MIDIYSVELVFIKRPRLQEMRAGQADRRLRKKRNNKERKDSEEDKQQFHGDRWLWHQK